MKIILLQSGASIEAVVAVNDGEETAAIRQLERADRNCLWSMKVVPIETLVDVLEYVASENAEVDKE